VKTLVSVVMATLAINFLALAGGAGWLWQSGHLNRDRVKAIREVMFPPATEPTTQPALAAAPAAPTASSRLEELLAKHIGVRSAGEQVEFLQQTFDAQMGQLDQRQRQLEDLQRLVTVAQGQLRDDRAKLETDRQNLTDQQQQANRLANDQGFQDSLTLYNSLPPKQVKSIFLAMDDDTAVDYLRAMPPRTAAKVLKEFKSPEELDRVHRLMDRMRDSDPTANPTTNPTKVQ
jgi:flagellar motility protein MotE (MotC chaperone)